MIYYQLGEVLIMLNNDNVLGNVRMRENVFLRKVYLWMIAGLLLTAAVAFFVASSEMLLRYVASNAFSVILLAVLQIGIVFILSSRIERLSVGAAIGCFLGYSVLTGITFSTIVSVFIGTGIIERAFLSTSVVFIVAALYGSFTKKAVQRWSSWLMIALLSVLLASLINLFMRSTALDYLISIAGIIIFSAVTAWDTNKLKAMNDSYGSVMSSEELSKISIMGALDIYLDFINIFIYFIRIFANSRDK